LEDFFSAAARHAELEEATFRARVEEIFAETAGGACDDAPVNLP
jgi:hypothetical protein